ncbi:uncharacterized protein LOC142177568 [Nicotiana tabacum]|uniref:Uncharacterized protein LOC142177568 n=1 Tax=Nicotiana tabacum TaxID=4097 RepID=A0AC58U027_TOBAC
MKIVVGPYKDLRKQILQFLHDRATGGHLGMIATLQRCKAESVKSLGLMQPLPIPDKVWQDISIDFIEGLPQSQPKYWAHWLPLAEWWYNTTYHSATKLTPFEVLYGQKPPLHMPYIPYSSMVGEVDRSLQAREATIRLLKHHLALAQSRIKALANKKRSFREFAVGDVVFIRLQPYR